MNSYPSIQSIKNSPCANRNTQLFEEKAVQKISGNGKKNNAKNQIVLQKRSKEKEWLLWNLQYFCNEKALTLETEYQFHPARKFRNDFAIPALKVAIEYEGLISQKSRHTTIKGYSSDTEKYNLQQSTGWKVFRVTALNYKSIIQTLNDYLDLHRINK